MPKLNPRITIAKVKKGEWRKRTFYWAYVDGEPIGEYRIRKDAVRAAEGHMENMAQYWKSLGEEINEEVNNA